MLSMPIMGADYHRVRSRVLHEAARRADRRRQYRRGPSVWDLEEAAR
jgi:hypothetical protein